MGNSYRIKATPGKDQNIIVQVDQDFEQLEILSLKIRQDETYLRMCADYGVIAGRVFANNGFGIPNAKVSIFIPVTDEDLQNPVIKSIYPYKTLSTVNEDGYKYNILPYTKSYSQHAPTGTFPTRKDVLVNQTAIELYDKYYKYTVQTNDSGDYLIYGVPVGTQTLVMNVDLSDIGEFSLGPQDLVRMGLATEDQIDGNKFKASPNFTELPQIVVINKTIDVAPFWGQPDVCQIGITRSDFDLTAEANIDFKPVAVFLGSLISTSNTIALKQNCKTRKETGNLCQMITGPGEILAITQTINHDSDGLPVLEKATLPNGGKLIDSDGTWMFDLPMNNNYVTTNEFGEQVLSNDPKVGIPTSAKYRFKIKWQQSKSISEDFKRGYFLVPNVKEKGWENGYDNDPLTGAAGGSNYNEAVQSYAFDLGWSGYTSGPTNLTNPEILSYINCEDRFYEFEYNKVYTVSGLIDNFKKKNAKEKFLAIKRIDDDTCDDSVNRFPSNDGVFHTSLNFIIFYILITIIGFIGYPLILVYDVAAFLINLIYLIITSILCAICGIGFDALGIHFHPFNFICDSIGLDCSNRHNPLPSLNLPMITYPDCEACDCNADNPTNGETAGNSTNNIPNQIQNTFIVPFNTDIPYTPLLDQPTFNTFVSNNAPFADKDVILQMMGGIWSNTPTKIKGTTGTFGNYSTNDLPFGERINLFNSKSAYYDGANQIKVTYEPTTNSGKFHYDNVVAIICDQSVLSLSAGTMFSFINPSLSKDVNITGATLNDIGTHNLTGTTHIPSSIQITYADPTNPNSPNIAGASQFYMTTNLYNANINKSLYYTFPSDIEYFEVITGMTLSDFRSNIPSTRFKNSFGDIIEGTTTITKLTPSSVTFNVKPIDAIEQNTIVVICRRGIDPYSPKLTTHFELGRIFGFNTHNSITIDGDYRLNIPIRNTEPSIGGGSGNLTMFDHNPGGVINNNTPNNGFNLFYPSYNFTPSVNYSGYNTNLHTYYSSLDYKTVTTTPFFKIITSNPSSALSTPYVTPLATPFKNVSGVATNSYYTSSTIITGGRKYEPYEFVDGGTYMYDSNAGYSYYFSPTYSTGLTLNMSYNNNIVMRSDRLPTSDKFSINDNNSYVLQQNPKITAYLYGTGGVITFTPGAPSPPLSISEAPDGNNAFENALDTFTCDTMVSLKCYQGNGLGVSVDNACKSSDHVTDKGCYQFCVSCDDSPGSNVFGPLLGIPKDMDYYNEYITRFKFFFALCQGVLGQVFNNNWVNGVLFAYPFKVNTFYGSDNKVSGRQFCTYTVMLHPTTNTFYYRSAPWSKNQSQFIGEKSPGDVNHGSNETNLKYPTTLLNMGPRESFLKEVSLNGNFDGYNMDQYSETSYKDTDEIINFFSLSRLLNSSFLSNFIGLTISKLFSRPGQRVDADFAQTIAVNSQIGVTALDTSHYSTLPTNPGGPSVVMVGSTGSDTVIGVYYSSSTTDVQVRDYVSPLRTIRWSPLNPTSFTYDYINNKSQLTPHYKWNIDSGLSIFGTQLNNWATSPNPSSISAVKYQFLDRLQSGYPIFNATANQWNARGYIYADNSNVFSATSYNSTASLTNNPALGGAPWYFYFGLKKGSTAMNKFYDKYIGENTLNE